MNNARGIYTGDRSLERMLKTETISKQSKCKCKLPRKSIFIKLTRAYKQQFKKIAMRSIHITFGDEHAKL